MRRISAFTPDEIRGYNLRDGGTAVTVFADSQAYRVEKARWFIEKVIPHVGHPATIIELGCSAGDISGWFSASNTVHGVDIVPAAAALAKTRYPAMTVTEGSAEAIEPQACDILILTEFLEHIDDPIGLVQRWLPLAKYALIGHPLNDPGTVEPGHIWSYTLDDYLAWCALGRHHPVETHLFSGPFPEMVMGLTER